MEMTNAKSNEDEKRGLIDNKWFHFVIAILHVTMYVILSHHVTFFFIKIIPFSYFSSLLCYHVSLITRSITTPYMHMYT